MITFICTIRCRPFHGLMVCGPLGPWGSRPRAGSPAEHLGWGARLYAVACSRRLKID